MRIREILQNLVRFRATRDGAPAAGAWLFFSCEPVRFGKIWCDSARLVTELSRLARGFFLSRLARFVVISRHSLRSSRRSLRFFFCPASKISCSSLRIVALPCATFELPVERGHGSAATARSPATLEQGEDGPSRGWWPSVTAFWEWLGGPTSGRGHEPKQRGCAKNLPVLCDAPPLSPP